MFRGHHIERVVQIESVLNKVAACEQEKTQLYSEMRFRAQRREQEKKPNHFLQELEETKAYLKGLGTALEFIQVEQENLVERVMAADEMREKIEAIGKASRAAEQKLVSCLIALCSFLLFLLCNPSPPLFSLLINSSYLFIFSQWHPLKCSVKPNTISRRRQK